MKQANPYSERITVRRGAKRACYDRPLINDILDANLICHVGFTAGGETRVIPTAYVRIDDALYLHGNRKNLMLNALLSGQSACVSVMQVDGLVLARSGFHHSVNYHSVVLFGKPVLEETSTGVLDALIDKMVAGRSKAIRPPTKKELSATLVVKIPIDEASAKVRTGPPVDDDEDYELQIWAGVLPLTTTVGAPQDDPRLAAGTALPDHLMKYASPDCS